MRTFVVTVALCAAVISAGCGATRKVGSAVVPGQAITGATIQFQDRDHGKDANSGVDVWVLHDNANEMAHMHSGIESSRPVTLSFSSAVQNP